MRDINSMDRGNALAQNNRNSVPCTLHSKDFLSDKGSAIKGLVVCNYLDLEPLDLLNSQAIACHKPSPECESCIGECVTTEKFKFFPRTSTQTLTDVNQCVATELLPPPVPPPSICKLMFLLLKPK